jgi:hypothetical protein
MNIIDFGSNSPSYPSLRAPFNLTPQVWAHTFLGQRGEYRFEGNLNAAYTPDVSEGEFKGFRRESN